ncbi:MAG TPA: TonB-dependent receptor [Steroidobacter sp.]|uniref:TonB-dependent receptor n=1 Tax=Steroidobacter sp. TaxID=1978227 RepID=UPI002EDAB832
MRNKPAHWMTRGLCSLPAALSITVAQAADFSSDDTVLEEIVVTAQLREEILKDVPIAITVVSEEQLTQQNINDISQLAIVSPAFTSHPGNGGALQIRGIGTQSYARSAEGDVAMILDNVALSGGANPQDPATLFDVARVEVLEGPQGTLFGKNAAAGAINIVTNAPDPSGFAAKVHLDYDERNSGVAQAVVNVPVGLASAVRASGYVLDYGRIYRNEFTDEWNDNRSSGGRLRYLYAPDDRFKVNLIADYNRVDGSGYSWSTVNAPAGSFLANALAACGVRPGRENNRTCLDAPSTVDFTNYGGSAQVDYQFDNGLVLSSITAGRRNEFNNQFDTDSVAIFNIYNVNAARQTIDSFSQELRLTSPAGDKIEYVAGLYYFDLDQKAAGDQAGTFNTPDLINNGLTVGNSFELTGSSRSVAAFSQATIHLTERFAGIVGVRYTHDEVAANTRKFVTPGSIAAFADLQPIVASTEEDDISGKLGIQYIPNDDAMAYASVTRGYKGPAINDQAPDPTVPLVVDSEIPYNYEIGAKFAAFNRRMQLAVTAYYQDIQDYQVQLFDSNTARSYFGNAESIEVYGVSASAFGRLTPDFFISTGLNYNHGEFADGTFFGCGPTQTAEQGCLTVTRGTTTARVADVSGKRILGSPEWKFVSYAEYQKPLGGLQGFIQADAVWSDSVTYTAVLDPGNNYESYWMLGARIGLRSQDGNWSVALFGRNLLDERIPSSVFVTPIASFLGAAGAHSQYLSRDSFRRIGLALDYRF